MERAEPCRRSDAYYSFRWYYNNAMNDLRRALATYFKQVLWALFLVYLVLGGVAYLFGKQIGYDAVLWVCIGIAILIAVTFISIYVFDSLRIIVGEVLKRLRHRKRND